MKKGKRMIGLVLAVMMTLPLAACGNKTANSGNADGKIVLEIGNWPTETTPASLERTNKKKQEFEELHPNVEIVPNTYAFEVKTFTAKAAAKQLPDLLANLPYTEVKSVIEKGYAADITDAAERSGLKDAITPELLEMCSDGNGRIYALPRVGYMLGLIMNKKLFTQAGLVNEDGTVKIPQTFEELAEFAVTIKERTGAAGFAMPTTNNQGGWILLNIAWNFGVEFEKQNGDGSWKATFDSPEFHQVLEWLYDLKWNKNVFADNSVIDANEMISMLATDRAAMIIGHSDFCNTFVNKFGMDRANLAMGKMPAGPAARYSQLGGSLYIMSPDMTDAQKDMAFEWLKHMGYSPKIDEATQRSSFEEAVKSGMFVFERELFNIWQSEERVKERARIAADYANVDMKNFEDYNLDGVTLRSEPEACSQGLYTVLDGVIQEVLSNKNVDIPAISKKAQEDFQANHLDKMN